MRSVLLSLLVLSGAGGAAIDAQAPMPAALSAPAPTTLDAAFVQGARVFGEGDLLAPVLLRMVDPKYTSDALRARVQGDVEIDIVIDAAGRVVRARVARSLDPVMGLDANALVAARGWTFEPGRLRGQPVAVVATITMSFRLH